MVLESQEILIVGSPICRGVAIGRAYFLNSLEETTADASTELQDVEAEVKRFRSAVEKTKKEIKQLQKRLQKERIYDGVAILDAHLQIMQDPLMTSHIENEIRKTGFNAEYIFHNKIKEYQSKFDSLSDPFFRERFKDILDISKKVIGYLREHLHPRISDIPQDSVVFATDLTAYDTAEASVDNIAAFVTKEGGATSHAAIVAKAKGIPYVSSAEFPVDELSTDMWVVVDGRTGEIYFNPSQETLERYQEIRQRLQAHLQKLKQVGQLDAETIDGYRILLSANIESINEIDMLHQYGSNGVGLFRTESAFLSKDAFPIEEEQFGIYSQFVEKMKGLPIVIRTFDLGGDKYLRNQLTEHESNPFLGCRAIRFLLKEKELFKIQLRAILRSSVYGNVRIMFPMVSSLSELLEAKEILEETKRSLIEEGKSIAERIPIGCMIEVPSAAIIADILAKECDFLSIGTNDLVQYSLAVDRSNNSLKHLYTPTHPCVLRLIRLVVSEANQRDIPVAVCGEVAADPRYTPLLLGLGVHELSVASRYIPVVKNAIRSTNIVSASKLAEQALSLSSAEEIEELLTREYRLNVPDDCFYHY